jgi:hypothetical protein
MAEWDLESQWSEILEIHPSIVLRVMHWGKWCHGKGIDQPPLSWLRVFEGLSENSTVK